MPAPPEKTWEQLKAEGRARYFQLFNDKLRKRWAHDWLVYGSLVRSCSDPRALAAALKERFPDPLHTQERLWHDHRLETQRGCAREWMRQHLTASPTVVDRLLSNKEFT